MGRVVACDNEECPELIRWELCIGIALSILLTLLIVFLLVILAQSKTATFNKLTLWPYYLMMSYSILAACQYACSEPGIETDASDWVVLFSISKGNFLYLAVGVQIFEWFNTYMQIMFQDQEHVDITNVVVLKRKFQNREKFYSKIILGLVCLYFFISMVIVLPFLLHYRYFFEELEKTDSEYIYILRVWTLTFALTVDVIFLLVTLALFIYAAYKKHRTAFLEYRFNLSLQVFGSSVLLGINLYQNVVSQLIIGHNDGTIESPFLDGSYLRDQII